MNLVKRLFQHGVDRFKRGKGCQAQRSKAVWQHQSDAKQGALRDLTFRTEANMQAIYMLMDSPSAGCSSLKVRPRAGRRSGARPFHRRGNARHELCGKRTPVAARDSKSVNAPDKWPR